LGFFWIWSPVNTDPGSLHTFWCRIWFKKNSKFGLKHRKQRGREFFWPPKIYGS